jgi:hypothetical protein
MVRFDRKSSLPKVERVVRICRRDWNPTHFPSLIEKKDITGMFWGLHVFRVSSNYLELFACKALVGCHCLGHRGDDRPAAGES